MIFFRKRTQKLKEWVRKNSTNDSGLSHLLQFTYRFFSDSLVQPITSILGTVVIAALIGIGYYKFFFWVIVVIYCITTFLIAIANDHIAGKIKDVNHFQNSLLKIGEVQRTWSISLQKSAKSFHNMNLPSDLKLNNQTKKHIDQILGTIDFQAAASVVCEKLSNFLSSDPHHTDVYVTVYQKYKSKCANGYEECKMIAYSERHEPTSFEKKYKIPNHEEFSENLFGKIEYHSYLFALGKKDISVLVNHDEVEKAFNIHDNCEDRESKIAQYICIPISPAKLGVTFLLQVDTSTPGKFGSDVHSITEFADNVIYPFAQFLHMIYEEGRTIEQLTCMLTGGK